MSAANGMPASLRKLIADNSDKIESGHTELDGWNEADGGDGWAYWIYFRPGWIDPLTEVHQIHESTVRAVQKAFRRIVACSCGECQKEKAQAAEAVPS